MISQVWFEVGGVVGGKISKNEVLLGVLLGPHGKDQSILDYPAHPALEIPSC